MTDNLPSPSDKNPLRDSTASNYSQLVAKSKAKTSKLANASIQIFRPKNRFINKILLEHLIHRRFTKTYERLENNLIDEEVQSTAGEENRLNQMKAEFLNVKFF